MIDPEAAVTGARGPERLQFAYVPDDAKVTFPLGSPLEGGSPFGFLSPSLALGLSSSSFVFFDHQKYLFIIPNFLYILYY